MTTKATYKYMITTTLLITAALLLQSCKKPTEPTEEKIYNRKYEWTIDTITYRDNILPWPMQTSINCIWGSSTKNVWAVGTSSGGDQVFHYDGNEWSYVKDDKLKLPLNGQDQLGHNVARPTCVVGFDSTEILIGCQRGYYELDTCVSMILKWNGKQWIDVPFFNGKRTPGGIMWMITDSFRRTWAVTWEGYVVRYENGVCNTEPKFTDYLLGSPVIAATNDGRVFVNAYKDSIENNKLRGQICNLFGRDLDGNWSLLEHKVILGSYYDDNGLGLGLFGIGDRIFTSNAGIWERKNNGTWIKISPPTFRNKGGACFNDENNFWFWHKYDLYHIKNDEWEKIEVPVLINLSGGFLYGQGWSDGKEVFIPIIHNETSYILHGKLK